jgi:hypothetical protein
MTKNCITVLNDISRSLWAGYCENLVEGIYNSEVRSNKLYLKINGQEFTIFIKKGNHTKEK